jgi:hypothetical protein
MGSGPNSEQVDQATLDKETTQRAMSDYINKQLQQNKPDPEEVLSLLEQLVGVKQANAEGGKMSAAEAMNNGLAVAGGGNDPNKIDPGALLGQLMQELQANAAATQEPQRAPTPEESATAGQATSINGEGLIHLLQKLGMTSPDGDNQRTINTAATANRQQDVTNTKAQGFETAPLMQLLAALSGRKDAIPPR